MLSVALLMVGGRLLSVDPFSRAGVLPEANRWDVDPAYSKIFDGMEAVIGLFAYRQIGRLLGHIGLAAGIPKVP